MRQSQKTTMMTSNVRPIRFYVLIIAAKVVCWLRLTSIILNPPASTEKFDLTTSFAANARTVAQEHLSKSIASKVASLAKQLLSSRQWTEKIPEQNLWEGISCYFEKCLMIGDPPAPVQPTRIPVQLVKELCSRLISLGIELLSPQFVLGTLRCCRERIATVYDEISDDVSSDAAIQLLADIIFLEVALSCPEAGELGQVKQKLSDKVSWINGKTDLSVMRVLLNG
jgi:hypothetical protein